MVAFLDGLEFQTPSSSRKTIPHGVLPKGMSKAERVQAERDIQNGANPDEVIMRLHAQNAAWTDVTRKNKKQQKGGRGRGRPNNSNKGPGRRDGQRSGRQKYDQGTPDEINDENVPLDNFSN